jgi:molybdenum cofactor cytidylyltransferase
MGQPKQLLPLGDKPVIRRCIDNIINAGIKELVVVVGLDAKATTEILSDLPVRVVVNNAKNSDMAGSVRVGLKALGQTFTGVLVCLVDHPLASGDTIKKLIEAHRQSPDQIIIPTCNGKRGHPSLFPVTILKEISTVDTLRDVVKRDEGRVQLIEVTDEGVVLDMDTPEDYERVLKKEGARERPDSIP